VPEPVHVLDALARHTWFARVLDVARTDTIVSWWTGSRTYLGIEAPRRLRAWPELRRVNVVATLIAIAFIDQVGRRKLLLAGLIGMGASLIIAGAAFRFIAPEGQVPELINDEQPRPQDRAVEVLGKSALGSCQRQLQHQVRGGDEARLDARLGRLQRKGACDMCLADPGGAGDYEDSGL